MAGCSSALFSAGDVVGLLDSSLQDDEDARLAALFDESDDDSDAIGDYTHGDGTQALISDETLLLSSMIAVSQAKNYPPPSDMDSLLNLDPELNDGKTYSAKDCITT